MTRPAPVLLLATLTALPLAAQAPAPAKPDVGMGLRKARERLAGYRWRLKTEMRVDGATRVSKLEDVSLAPDGGVVRKIVKYERSAQPTPFPENDPRARTWAPPSGTEEDRLLDVAQELLQYYLRLSPERVADWTERAELLPADSDHPALARLHGRGLGRREDDAVLYFDPGTEAVSLVEIKTTVDPRVLDIAFIRMTFEALPQVRPDVPAVRVPKRAFLNMHRARRTVALEMETSDWRTAS